MYVPEGTRWANESRRSISTLVTSTADHQDASDTSSGDDPLHVVGAQYRIEGNQPTRTFRSTALPFVKPRALIGPITRRLHLDIAAQQRVIPGLNVTSHPLILMPCKFH